MKRLLGLAAVAFLAWTAYVDAQPAPTGFACPYIQPNAVLTAAQWNYCFQIKQDNLSYTPLNTNGGTMTGALITAPSVTFSAGFNVPPGIPPTTPNNGDIWTTGGGLFARVNGVTYNLAAPSFVSASASVNFNAGNADTAFPVVLPPGFSRFRVDKVIISGASGTLTTATFGVFTAPAGGGAAIVTAATAVTVNTAAEGTNNNMQSATINNALTESYNTSTIPTIFFRLGTAEGSAATGTVSMVFSPVS